MKPGIPTSELTPDEAALFIGGLHGSLPEDFVLRKRIHAARLQWALAVTGREPSAPHASTIETAMHNAAAVLLAHRAVDTTVETIPLDTGLIDLMIMRDVTCHTVEVATTVANNLDAHLARARADVDIPLDVQLAPEDEEVFKGHEFEDMLQKIQLGNHIMVAIDGFTHSI